MPSFVPGYRPKKRNEIESIFWRAGNLVLGVDEVGRGCLAGPVVVAAALIPPGTDTPLLRDSKELSARQLQDAAHWIRHHCRYQIVSASARIVDQDNIYRATQQLMEQAILQLLLSSFIPRKQLKGVIIDAMPLTQHFLSQDHGLSFFSFPKAESLSSSVAAASIIAKVTRDELISDLSQSFPAYQLEKHKGYGTMRHWNALRSAGPSLIHRTTFLKRLNNQEHHANNQQALF